MSIKTKAQLATEADSNITTNGNNEITGAILNTMLNNTFDSVCSIVDTETWNGVKTFGSFPITPSSAPTTDYQVANKKYVDDSVTDIGDWLYKSVVSLNTSAVASLGTSPKLLVAAPGTGYWINPVTVVIKMDVASTLDVGSQNLVVTDASDVFSFVDNTTLEAVTTGNFVVWKLYEQSAKNVYVIRENIGLYLTLSGSTNPASGEATMTVTTYYTVEDFATP